MRDFTYVKDFENMGFGMFVHFGLYSVAGKGEWHKKLHGVLQEEYDKLIPKFKVKKTWAKDLVKTAKAAGAKYITLTTRHHDGFSLFDTCGLNTYDAVHSPVGRDLVREFVDECNAQGIVPFFYHTLLDWWNKDYQTDFPAYIDYLIKSVELLCKNYGKIGGLWFDGMWDKKDEDWQEDRLYATIRKYQPEAMIINNTGLSELGKVGHYELDSVTFERGKPCFVDNSDRPRAGEMCQVLNSHWGYAAEDCNYKPMKEIIFNLVDCRRYNCNLLLNLGPRGNGAISPMDREMLLMLGKWIKKNKNFIYDVKSCDIPVEGNAILLQGKDCIYAVMTTGMAADINVQLSGETKKVTIGADIKRAIWLDNGEPIQREGNTFEGKPFAYGTDMACRVAKIWLK